MGKSKRTETSVTVTKKARALPPIHESQERLAKRALECDEDEAIIIVAPPGNGKTRAMGRYIKLRQEEGGLSLTFYVGATAYMCNKQSYEVGSTFDYCFQYAKQHRQITQMLMEGTSVVTTMTPAMFNKVCFGDHNAKVDKKDPDYEEKIGLVDVLQYFKSTILRMVQGTKCTTIRFVLDEMHIFFDHGYPDAIKALRKAADPIEIVVTGMTATLPDDMTPLAAMTGCDVPAIIEYTPEEMAAFDKDLRLQPNVGSFETIKMADASREDRFADSMANMAATIVGAMLEGEKTILTRTCLEHATSIVLAKQAHGGGGQTFAHLTEEPMKCVDKNGKLTGEFKPHHEALIIAHSTLCGASTAWTELATLQGQEDVRDFSVHDLRSSEVTSLDQAIKGYNDTFKAQEKPTLAIMNPTMRHSTNALGKNTSGARCYGHWTRKGLKQLAGRLSRPCTLVEGDIVPQAYTLIHYESDWQLDVLAIRATRVSPRDVKLSEEESKMLDQVLASEALDKKAKATIEQNVYKLAKADERRILGGTTMVTDYLEALTKQEKMEEMLAKREAAIKELLTYKGAENELKTELKLAEQTPNEE